MADSVEMISEGSSSGSPTPSTPPPKRHKKSKKQLSVSTGQKHRHGVRKGKRKSKKGKRKYVTSSSSSTSSSSYDSIDSESPDRHHVTSRKVRHFKKTATKKCLAKNPKDGADILQNYYARLVTLMSTCVDTMTSKLFSKHLIPHHVLDQVITGQDPDTKKASKVLHSVMQQIEVDPEKLGTFVEVLKEEPVFDDLAKEILSEIGSGQERQVKGFSSLKTDSNDILRYSEYLKAIYSQAAIARDDKLATSPCTDFISLALVKKQQSHHDDPFSKSTYHGGVDQILASKTPLELDALVTPGSPFVLVEGPPGIGKSTMCWELCRKWETLKSLQDFKIVLQLKLREKHVQNATSLHQLFYHDDKKLCEGIVDFVLSCDGEGVLLVLDGFDELPSSVVSDSNSLIMRLIRGQCLPRATRLVTSRPSALHQKKLCFPQEYRHVEILGFTDECKVQFAKKAFEADPEIFARFQKFIFSNPIITSLMYIPVHCAIIAQVYKDLPDITVPKTMTQLYTLLVLVLIRRHLIQTGKWTVQSKVSDNLEGLPKKIKRKLKRVSKLAYEGLMKNDVQVTFTVNDMKHLGLLNEAKEMYVSKGAVAYYSFLHLSIQEFLAAWHVKCHPHLGENATSSLIDNTSRHIKPHLVSFGRFLSGMQCYDLIEKFLPTAMIDDTEYIISCCYEAQNTSCLIKPDTRNHIYLSSPLDMYMFGYTLVHAPIQWILQAQTSLDMLASSIADHSPDGEISGSVDIRLFDRNTTFDSLPQCLLESIIFLVLDETTPALPSTSLSNLQSITVVYGKGSISHPTIQSLLNIDLKNIYVSISDVTMETGQGLCHYLEVTSTLEKLNIHSLYSTVISLWHVQNLVKPALSCSSLKYIYIECFFSKLSTDYLCSIVEMCAHTSKAVMFKFMFNQIVLADNNLLAVLNSSLHSNPSLSVNMNRCFYFSFLSSSCALRKDPDTVRRNLRRSRSLSHLLDDVNHEGSVGVSRHQSCPDLLEIQSLHNIHPKLYEAIYDKRIATRLLWSHRFQHYYDLQHFTNLQ